MASNVMSKTLADRTNLCKSVPCPGVTRSSLGCATGGRPVPGQNQNLARTA